ncbi:carboxylate--amine ligase [Streptomyces sp. NBRC 110611]|nr:carboxylate--amine ligase [Streptomyces sp. NBRC 110611]
MHIAVVPAAGHHPEPGTLGNFVTERKGALSAPAAVHIVPDIPLTPVGKPDKKRLRAVLGR